MEEQRRLAAKVCSHNKCVFVFCLSLFTNSSNTSIYKKLQLMTKVSIHVTVLCHNEIKYIAVLYVYKVDIASRK